MKANILQVILLIEMILLFIFLLLLLLLLLLSLLSLFLSLPRVLVKRNALLKVPRMASQAAGDSIVLVCTFFHIHICKQHCYIVFICSCCSLLLAHG